MRTVVHLHGAKVPPHSDGYPENWYTAGHSAMYRYPNEQDATMLWYHDHAMGVNRLNIMAGLFGLYIVRDAEEEALDLPRGKYEVPLVLCDRMLTPDGQLTIRFRGWKARPYRLRVANVSNGRFYNLSLTSGDNFHQIATDQGLVSAPVKLDTVFLAPAERMDVVIDFSRLQGQDVVLRNGAVDILQFRVAKETTPSGRTLPTALRPVLKIPESEAVRTRYPTLEENVDVLDAPMIHLLNGARWHDPVTEKPKLGTTEIWALINLTEDSHPIHIHLTRFQILDRRSFDDVEYLLHRRLRYTDDPAPPAAGETGWKDTVQAHPKMVTRIIVRFEGYSGRYVWHCHIIEHDDNEMMRPFDVLAG